MSVFIERAETEKIDKKNQYTGIDKTHHLPEHFQEHQNRSVQCIGAESFSLAGNVVYLSEKLLSELQISLVSRSNKKLNIPQNISNMETS